MELKRLRTTAALACGGGMIALAVTGCNASGSASASSDSRQSSPTSSPSSRASSRAASARAASSKDDKANGNRGAHGRTAYTGSGSTPGCMAGELRADLQIRTSNSVAKGIGTLILTNRSNHSCIIPAGWAPIGAGGANNYTPLPATLARHPGSGHEITLRAGHSAYAGMKWHTAAGCGTTSGLGVAWHSSWIPLRYLGLNGNRPPICDYLVLGTIQPTKDGVDFT